MKTPGNVFFSKSLLPKIFYKTEVVSPTTWLPSTISKRWASFKNPNAIVMGSYLDLSSVTSMKFFAPLLYEIMLGMLE